MGDGSGQLRTTDEYDSSRIPFRMLFAVAVPSSSASTGTSQDIAGSVAGTLGFEEDSFYSVAEAMPAEKYAFVPTAGNFKDARSLAEQVKHVACAQFAFFKEIEGKAPPDACERGGPDKAKTKAELLEYLKNSFDYGNRVVHTITAQNALDRVEGRYGGPNTRLGIAVVAVSYITDHYGQLVEYLRMNGLVPPATQKYGLKPR